MSQLSRQTHPLVRDGRSQEDRRLPALSPDYVQIDGRRLEDILDFVYEYARQVNYYDQTLQKDDWLAFFRNSLPFQLARISLFDVDKVETEYAGLAGAASLNPELESLQFLMDYQYGLADQIDYWRSSLSENGSDLGGLIESIIQTTLSPALARLISIANTAGPWGYRPPLNLFNFQAGWGLSFQEILATDPALATGHENPRQRFQQVSARLYEIFRLFLEGLRKIVEQAGVALRQEVEQNQLHQPHLGLFYTFLELFKYTRNDLNALTKKHLDFFYTQVLQLQEKDAVPDKAHLVFELAKQVGALFIEAGTEFSAGKDATGAEIHFRLDEDMVVNKTQVESLRTLFLDQEKTDLDPNDPELEDALYRVKGIYQAPQADSADGQGEGFKDEGAASWETLGEKKSKLLVEPGNGAAPFYQNYPFASLGMILSSSVLLLKEGNRTIQLAFTFDKDFLEKILAGISALETAVKTQFALTDNTIAALTENGYEGDIVENVLKNKWQNGKQAFLDNIVERHLSLNSEQKGLLFKYAERQSVFSVFLTGEKEWAPVQEINSYLVKEWDADQEETGRFRLVFELTLDEAFPPVVDFDPEAHGAGMPVNGPAVKLEYNHNFKPFGPIGAEQTALYHYFRFLEIRQIEIKVAVNNVRSLVLQNDGGLLNPDNPFQPFGPTPRVGSQFYMGSREIFQKNITKLDLDLSWEGLPQVSFEDHYLGYQKGDLDKPTSSDFMVDVSLLQNRNWNKITAPSSEALFESMGLKPLAERSISFKLSPKVLRGVRIAEELTEFNVNSISGFLRFTLKPQDFLHGEFSQALGRQLLAVGSNAATPAGTVDSALYLDTTEYAHLTKRTGDSLEALLAEVAGYFDSVIENPLYGALKYYEGSLEKAFWEGEINTVKNKIDQAIAALVNINVEFDADIPSEQNINNWLQSLDSLLNDKDGAFAKLTAIAKQFQENGAGQSQVDVSNVGAAYALELLELLETGVLPTSEKLKLYFFGSKTTPNGTDPVPPKIPVPIEPYTPTVSGFKVHYEAFAAANQIRFFHLYPYDGAFLERKVEPLAAGESAPELLPKFIDQGSLFIGLQGLAPGGTIQLLFQMAESTADPFMERADIQWHYLSGNQWKELRKEFNILSDETDGLLGPGVIKLSIPKDITNDNTILPSGTYWLKVSVKERAEAVSESIAVHAQAARVTFVDKGNDPARLKKSLDAEMIAKPVENIGALKGVLQAYPSFDGRPREAGEAYYTRVSERLRHKGRAITLFDFERLILDQFPGIYKVKCITHTLGRRGPASGDNHLAPGFITIVVIPDLRQLGFSERFEPKASLALLEKIEAFIRQKTSPFARIRALNPDYEPVHVEAKVKFAKGIDANYFKEQLREDVRELLAPWAFDPTSNIAFGGRVFRSTILGLVEKQDYVDFVTDFEMFGADGKNVPELAARSARSILVPGEIRFEAIL